MKLTLFIACLFSSMLSSAQLDSMVKIKKSPSDSMDIFIPDSHQSASYKGGNSKLNAFIAHTVKYPEIALENNIEGNVIVQFVVEDNGTVSQVKVVGDKHFGYGLEEEAIRVIKKSSGDWVPAKSSGKFVRTYYRLPISFKLN